MSNDKKIEVTLTKEGNIDVKFPEEHFPKRELLRILKSIKLQYRRNVREYRKKVIRDNLKEKEKENGTGTAKTTKSGTEQSRTEGTAKSAGSTKANR